jgi:hypothetical protein
MATLQQIEANRANAQKSTGPRSAEGRAAVRFNALKTGIDAQSQVIPGEDPAALALLAAEYYDRYQPATPEVRALVDTLVTAEWLQRRFRALEAQLWQFNIQGLRHPVAGLEVSQVYDRDNETFGRLQRRIDATERTYLRALATLQKIESRAPQPDDPIDQAPDPRPPTPGPASVAGIPQAPGPASEADIPPTPDPLSADLPKQSQFPAQVVDAVGHTIRLTAAPTPEKGVLPIR